jgi:hypothetical protein
VHKALKALKDLLAHREQQVLKVSIVFLVLLVLKD